MMEIIQPLRVKPIPPRFERLNHPWSIQVALGDHVYRFPAMLAVFVDLLVDVLEYMYCAIVRDGMYGIQPQAVYMKVMDPVKRIAGKELAHAIRPGAIKVQCRTPWCAIGIRKVRAKPVKIVAFRPHVVVYHVQDHRNTLQMAGVYHALQPVSSAVGLLHRV